MQSVQLQESDDDDDCPALKSSSSSDDTSGSESEDEVDEVDVQTSQFWTPSDAFLQCHPNGEQTFELYEEDVDEEQEHDLFQMALEATATCAFDQQMAMPQIRSVSVTNNQSDCKNGHTNNQVVHGLVAGTSVQTLVAAPDDQTTVHFVLDSGCTRHIFDGSRENFTNFSSRQQRISTAGDKSGLSAARWRLARHI